MSNFSKRSQSVSPSLTLALTAKAAEMRNKGLDVISFGVGEPDFNTPDYIVQAAKEAMDKGLTRYTAVGGTPSLRRAIVQKLHRDNNLEYLPVQIVVSGGAKQSLFNVMQLLLDEGDEVVIPSPYWLTYPELVKMCGGKCVFAETYAEDGFILQPEHLDKAMSKHTKAVILNSPNNPTGAVYSMDQMTALAKVLENYPDTWIISDEIYEKLTYDNLIYHSVAECKDMYDRTFVINGVSKAYAMTGWRIGYCAAPTVEAAKAMEGLQSHQTSNPNTIAQYATEAALTQNSDSIDKMRDVFAERRDFMLSILSEIDKISYVRPSGAFYIMVDVSKTFGLRYNGEQIDGAKSFAEKLLETERVVTVPCEGFGAPDFIRLSYAADMETIKRGLEKLAEFIGLLK